MFEQLGEVADAPEDLGPLFASTWTTVASAGSTWTGAERVAIAEVARAARVDGTAPSHALPAAACEAAALISYRPSQASEPWARHMISALGQERYVELVEVVAAVAGVDTVTQLLDAGLEPLPAPTPGEPQPAKTDPRLKRRSAWVAMSGPPVPRHALTAVPRSQATVSRLLDRLYMPKEDLRTTTRVRGITREQMESVILGVSLANECFY